MSGVLRSISILLCIYLAYLSPSFAQSTSKAITSSPVYKAESFFNSSIKYQSWLYNGPAFQGYASTVEGSANFQDLNTFSNGAVVYQGFRFDNIPLMYDIYQDKLISVIGNYSKFSLVSDRVTDFYLNDHHFKYINVIDTSKSIIKSGFYDLIHDGKSKILVKRTKSIQVSIQNGLTQYFVPKTYFYIQIGQDYAIIHGEKSFLNYFKDKKPELKKLIKQKKIKFRKQPEASMALLASYYESLTN